MCRPALSDDRVGSPGSLIADEVRERTRASAFSRRSGERGRLPREGAGSRETRAPNLPLQRYQHREYPPVKAGGHHDTPVGFSSLASANEEREPPWAAFARASSKAEANWFR